VIVVVMGVSGAGKTIVGRALAQKLGAAFIEGDAFHPPENVQKMRRGAPLDDTDRGPWLQALAAELAAHAGRGESAVLACSALKRSYRTILRAGAPGLRLVCLDGPVPLIRRRLEERAGHYMPASLLDSQLAILEPPAGEECGIRVGVDAGPAQIVAAVLARLNRAPEDQQA
jgi:gluconokinase